MKARNLAALICAAMILTATAGCSANNGYSESDNSQNSTEQSSSSTEQSSEDGSHTAQTVDKTVKVTSIDGNSVMAEAGELTKNSTPQGGNPPEMPSGGNGGEQGGTPPEMPNGGNGSEQGGAPPEMPNGGNGSEQGGTPPEMPNGGNDSGQGGTPPEKPNGNGGGTGGAPGGMGSSNFTSNGEIVTFNISDSTKITVEFLQGSSEGSLDDIAVGSVLDITLDDNNNNAVAITVRNLNVGSGFGGSSEVTNGTSANTIEEKNSVSNTEYSSTGNDENALRIDSADVTLENITLNKNGGDSSNTENGDFYGQNAGLLALNGANVIIKNSTFNTDAVNGNAIFSYGEGTVVNVYDSVIRTMKNNSGGIQTTGGGTTNAYNLDVETQGNSAAAIRSDRGGGTVYAENGSFVTNGTGSPAIYCTADITASGATLIANNSEGIVVEGKNSVALENCIVTGNMSGTYNGDSSENIHCIMIYQSMSGDADLGEANFSANGGRITALAGDMFYITNTDCTISLENVEFTLANDTFLRVEGNDSSRGWGTVGANGGDVVLTAKSQKISGNIIVDKISSLDLTLSENSDLNGAINSEKSGGEVKVTLKNSTWNLTADSYITEFNGDVSSVVSNGYHLYVNGEQVV